VSRRHRRGRAGRGLPGARQQARPRGRQTRCRCDPAGVRRRVSQMRRPMLPSPPKQGLGLRVDLFRGYFCVHFRYGPVTRSPSLRWLCR
jgi:hypothetical protein